MADLGNLQFSVSLKDMTDADIKKIKDKLEKAGFKINASADRKSLEKNINDILKNRTFKINVEPNKKIKKAAIEVNKSVLSNSVTNALKGKTFKANVDVVIKTASVQDAIKQAFAKAGMNYNTTASDVRAQRILEIQQRMALRAAQANNNLNRSYREASSGASQFARATVGLSNGLQSNIRFGGKIGTVLGNLASILNSTNILKDVIRIGGELENQRIALGAILQDGGKATEMFSRIQSLAVKSPFGIMDLNQYTKQLSAYGIEYNELYETMKRLADISAGVGVDMGRIILAFGQVKAAGFLKGTELRQFTEANIPMVEKLAEKFSILRNEIVSAGEVYDMISDKKITFEDVKDVLWGLTDEGGMFNNMQEVLSESLASKWKNLSDAVDVMFGNIADGSVGDGLKWIASALTELTKQWDKLFAGVSTVVGLFASKNLAKSALIYSLSSVKGSTVALSRELVDIRRLANIQLGATNNIFRQFAINIKQSMSNGLAYTKAFVANFIPMIKKIGVALKSIAWSSLPFVAITAIAEGFNYFMNKSEESAKRIKDVTEAASQGFENLSNRIKSIGDNMPKSTAAIKSAMQSMETALKDYAPNSDAILGDINQADKNGNYRFSDEERYKKLNQALKDTKEAYRILATEMEGFSETANKATDGVFNESFRDNIEDASDAMQVYRQSLNAISIEGVKYENAIKKAAEADADFAKAIDGKNLRESLSLLKDFPNAFDAFMSEGAYVGGKIYLGFIDSIKELRKQQDIALDDANLWTEKYKGLLQSAGWDLENLTQERKIAISVDVTRFLNSIEGLDDETKKLITESVLEKQFNIKLTSNEQQVVEDKAKPEYDPSKDEVAKLWKKRAEEIDKAVAAYDKWKKVEGAGKAEQRIKGMDEFENLFNERYGFSLSLENPTAVYEYIQSKLNKNLSAQKELILSLGVKISDAELKDAQEKVKLLLENTKNQIKETSDKWNLYKQLFEFTGDKGFAMTAFNITPVWDEAAKEMKAKLEDSMKTLGLDFDADFDIDDSTAKEIYGELYDSWKQIKDRIEKNGIDLKVNAANAIKDTKSVGEQIQSLENQRDEELGNYTEGTTEYEAVAERWNKQIQELRNNLWELSPEFKKLFVDTTGMSVNQIENLRKEAQRILAIIQNGTPNIKTGMVDFEVDGNSYSIEQEAIAKLIEWINKLGKKTSEVKNSFSRLGDWINGKEQTDGTKLQFKDVAKDLSLIAQEASNAAQSISSMFDALGDEATADAFALGGNILSGISNIGEGIASGNPFAVINGVTGIIGSIAQFHDKKLDRAIRKSQLEVTKLTNAYKQLERTIERQLGSVTSDQSKKMIDNLRKQRSELQKQYNLEDDKKKTDASKLQDYKSQIAELDDQIKYFYEDLASEQYGVDIKGWSSQIAEALTEAFATGEDAAKAFDNTVADILRNLATQAIQLQFIEPAMESLRKYMFGDSGIFTDNSAMGKDLSASEAAGLKNQLDKLKGQIEASNDYWDKINDAVGGILDSTEKSGAGGLSKEIQGVTEDTANLLGSYLNSIRHDVSVKRSIIEKLAGEDIPKMSLIAQAQLTQLNNIAANTLRNAEAADRIYDLFNRVVDKGGNKLKI